MLGTPSPADQMTGACYPGVIDLSGTEARNTTLSLPGLQGPRESPLTNCASRPAKAPPAPQPLRAAGSRPNSINGTG
jgi:hypothetical protein